LYAQNTKKSYNTLKPLQIEAVKAYLEGDTIVTLPTGYGKSLTYELLPFLEENVLALIVVPVDAVHFQETQKLGDMSLFLSPELLEQMEKGDNTFQRILNGTIKYIFIHPETTGKAKFKRLFTTLTQKVYIIVDEAHCVEMWGESFRPSFRRIGELRALFKRNTMIAMSATVSPESIKNLKKWLQFGVTRHIASCPIRENIFLETQKRPPSTGKGRTAESSYEEAFNLAFETALSNDHCNTVMYCSLHWCQFGLEYLKRKLGVAFWVNGCPKASLYHASLHAEVF
jgi:superfamily II DNA helicase RecQ